MYGARIANVQGLKVLKTPEEGGTKKEHKDFLEKIENHVEMTWPKGGDIAYVLTEKEDPYEPEPRKLTPEEELLPSKVAEHQDLKREYREREKVLKENKRSLFALLLSNVSQIMKSKLQSVIEYEVAKKTKDVIWLLKEIEDVMIGFEKIKAPGVSLDEQMGKIMSLRQKPNESNEEFIKMVKTEIKVFERHGGDFMWSKDREKQFEAEVKMEQVSYRLDNDEDMDEARLADVRKVKKKVIKDEIAAITIIRRVDKKRFGNLLIGFENEYLKGKDDYPKSTAAVLRLLNNYKPEWSGGRPPNQQTGNVSTNRGQGVNLLQTEEVKIKFLGGKDNSFFPNITCFLCKRKGHYKSQCPVRKDATGARLGGGNRTQDEGNSNENENENQATEEEEVSLSRVEIILNQLGSSHLHPYWILLDSASSDHLFCNQDFLTDTRTMTNGEQLRLISNGGFLDTNQKGFFGKIEVWFNPQAIANVLSLAKVTDQYRVTMDSETENAFNMHISEENVLKFKRISSDLYYTYLTLVRLIYLGLGDLFLFLIL